MKYSMVTVSLFEKIVEKCVSKRRVLMGGRLAGGGASKYHSVEVMQQDILQ